jgi:hypothetical protein
MEKLGKTPASKPAWNRVYSPSARNFTGFLSLLMLLLFSSGDLLAQVTGPAFGSIEGGATVSTGEMLSPPAIITTDQFKVRNLHWETQDPPRVDDIFNNTPPSAPEGSNIFIDPATLEGPTRVSDAPGVMIDFEGIADRGNIIPPDPILAAGPNHIMALVNSEFVIYDKQGNELFRTLGDAWFQNVLPGADTFDPVIIYDHFEGRWVMLWDHWNDIDEAFWLISVSDDSDPMGTWCNYAFPANLNGMNETFTWGDYPKMAYDHQAIYVSGRQFSYFGGFSYCKMRIIPKDQLYDLTCGPVDYTDFWDFRDPENTAVRVDGPPIAASHLDSTDNVAYIVVDSPYSTSTFISLWTIEDPLGVSPTVTGVNIPTTAASAPPNANQLGGGFPGIDSGRMAYRNAVYTNGQIWTATAVRGGTSNQYAFARYLRLRVDVPSAIEDVAFGSDGFFYLYPAIMVDEDLNMVMVFSRSADDEYCGAAYTGRRLGEDGLAPSVLLKEGEANYVKTFSGSRNRWGDYMGIAQDPDDTNIIWSMVEYAASPEDTWGNWIGAYGYQYMASGTITDAVTSDPVEFATLTVVETGNTITTDSTGTYSLASPFADVTLNVSAFAYQDQSVPATITLNTPIVVDIELQPEITATFSGQVLDPDTQEGVAADLEFYARGNPYPGPYATLSTDPTGNFSFESIIGTYDIIADGASPYRTDVPYDSLVLVEGGTDIELPIDPAEVMLVDDDEGSEYESYFLEALRSITISYHLWSTEVSGEPAPADLAAYPDSIVIWFTGDGATTTLSTSEATTLAGHLNNGGSLFLTGQDIAEDTEGSELMNVLGINFLQDNANTLTFGIAGTIMEGLIFTTSGTGGANNQTSRDQIVITDSTTTTALFEYGVATSDIAGVLYQEGSAKAVHLGFGWEAIHNSEFRESVMHEVMFFFDPVITGIETFEPGSRLPTGYDLSQNYPNPFNPSTTISFDLSVNMGVNQPVNLTVYDIRGRHVRTLVDSELSPGSHKIHWDGRNDRGESVASGIYLYTLSAGDERFTRKMTVLK